MRMHRTVFLIGLLLLGGRAEGAECEVSLPERQPLPERFDDSGLRSPLFTWVGGRGLAALVPSNGRWNGMGSGHRYRDKWWWWREGYRARDETRPQLVIRASRLDGPAPPVHIPNATNAYGPGWDLMLVGMEFPSAGCWEVVASYHGHKLRFVFEVGADDKEA